METDKENHEEQLIQDLKSQTNNFRLLALFVVVLVVGSAWFYHVVEKWNWLDSFYYIIVTLGTVGYGDYTPKTDAGKLYAMVLIVVGIGVFGFFAQQLLKRQQLKSLKRQLKRAETKTPKI